MWLLTVQKKNTLFKTANITKKRDNVGTVVAYGISSTFINIIVIKREHRIKSPIRRLLLCSSIFLYKHL